MNLKFQTGRLRKTIAMKKHTIIPYSETIQRVEVTKLANGELAENEDHINREKEAILASLQEKYGDIEEGQITWVFVNKKAAGTEAPPTVEEAGNN